MLQIVPNVAAETKKLKHRRINRLRTRPWRTHKDFHNIDENPNRTIYNNQPRHHIALRKLALDILPN
jgi:hypothetical protein